MKYYQPTTTNCDFCLVTIHNQFRSAVNMQTSRCTNTSIHGLLGQSFFFFLKKDCSIIPGNTSIQVQSINDPI